MCYLVRWFDDVVHVKVFIYVDMLLYKDLSTVLPATAVGHGQGVGVWLEFWRAGGVSTRRFLWPLWARTEEGVCCILLLVISCYSRWVVWVFSCFSLCLRTVLCHVISCNHRLVVVMPYDKSSLICCCDCSEITRCTTCGVKHPVPLPDRVKESFVIFDIRALWRSALGVRVPGCQKLGVKGLIHCRFATGS